MTAKDFWSKSTIAVVGAGSWGTVLAHMAAHNCNEVRLWMRDEDQARAINSTRSNPKYVKHLSVQSKVRAFSEPERIFDGDGVQAVIWVLPSKITREQAQFFSKYMKGDEIVIHATKGVEAESLKRISQILSEELPVPRIGVLSGPNLAHELAHGQPAATVVASNFSEVVEAGQSLFATDHFRVYGGHDMVGVEWAGTLKNILAIASGAVDALNMGWNTRAALITRGLAEMVRFGVAMGADESTFLGLAGVGDFMATCCSPLSRNYRVGYGLGSGKPLADILSELGETAEGVMTTKSVWEFAKKRNIYMPITEGVYQTLYENLSYPELLKSLMKKPQMAE